MRLDKVDKIIFYRVYIRSFKVFLKLTELELSDEYEDRTLHFSETSEVDISLKICPVQFGSEIDHFRNLIIFASI